MTIEQLLSFGEKALAASSDSAKLDAQILLCHVLDKPHTYLIAWPETNVEASVQQQYSALIARRREGEPIAYITGEREFWSLTLKTSPATLIPRADTESLVETVLSQHPQADLKLLDLGTGTGAIALALASEQPSWQVDAVDFNQDAVALANENKTLNQLNHVNVFQSDWFEQVADDNRYDIIVSNPPYIDESDSHLSQGDLRFEPNTALVASDNGYGDIIHIIEQARHYLNQGASLYLEHGFEQAEKVRALFAKFGYANIQTIKDYAGNDRVTYAQYTR
ncbi:peptide chain release factor N(5)-glutamine methyltransferase [Thalassotalea agarivorans]|uniref:Release factor glutamine methyltransferase n=1 Tax=Thalassotalea agarivorans TaxID=349064 RepID=A0A1I0FGC6_THASX|nr:peptide chain release factor N(5)-glutamine methyltransferase [Thalassotalea agarivorans]SET56443.1 [protein release factor]-glutamine N5-methyltransferase [Thalassotalea agarivorans]